MSNVLETQPGAVISTSEPDIQSVRDSFARALSHLARGDRRGASLGCKETLLQMPSFAPGHSLAGLLALLSGDLKTARVAYERAAGDLRQASPERERLIALRVFRADETEFDINDFVTDLSDEIQHLRDSGETFFQKQNNTNSQPVTSKPATASFASPVFSVPTPAITTAGRAEPLSDFRDNLKRRRQISMSIMLVIAVIAALLSFAAVRALFWPEPAPAPIPIASQERTSGKKARSSTSTAPSTETQNTTEPVPDSNENRASSRNTPAESTSESSTAPLPTVAPTRQTAPVPAPATSSSSESMPVPGPVRAEPAPAAAASAPTSTSTVTTPASPGPRIPPVLSPSPRVEPAPAARELPGQLPGSTSSPVPGASPPRPAPAAAEEPLFPPMPRPRVTLPSAGHAPTEFPRVIAENG